MPGGVLRLRQKVEAASVDHVPLIADRVAATLDTLGRRDEALQWLARMLQSAPAIDLLDVAYRRTRDWQGPQAAEALVSHELARHPSLLGFERLTEARLALNPDDAELASLDRLLKGHASKLARYRCSRCGFRTREYQWNCPGCSSWDSYPPRRVEELDGT